MFASTPERVMHRVRWALTVGWLLLIASLFYDPWTAALRSLQQPWNPFRIVPGCVLVQGQCRWAQAVPIGNEVFWGFVVPSAILILLLFGHELWRRICPLSFLSQIPRALGLQRQIQRQNPKTGKIRSELVKISPDSWLGQHYPLLQFGWLYLGLCMRILLVNADRLVLAGWLLGTIALAILAGYLYGGKAWCQYFCPMAPVQQIFGEPGGLLTSRAQTSETPITQSMCRTVTPEGKEQSACVACQAPCIDIDAERSHWHRLEQPAARWLPYAYLGLIAGYFGYYYLYAGNWRYYFSGLWSLETGQASDLLQPGIYWAGQALPIPKLLAVPLTLALTVTAAILLGRVLERAVRGWARRRSPALSVLEVRHRLSIVCTWLAFNGFFAFAGRPVLLKLPPVVLYLWETIIILLSTLWLYHTWFRSLERYQREALGTRFRRQLVKLKLEVEPYLEGRSIDQLDTHEVYILAKVLPGFSHQKRLQAYQGVLRESLQEGYVNSANSLEVLRQIRQELEISDAEHLAALEAVGVEDPSLFDPARQRDRETLVRLTGYRQALERVIALREASATAPPRDRLLDQLLAEAPPELRALRQEYGISPNDEAQVVEAIDPTVANLRRADYLIDRLTGLVRRSRALHQPALRSQGLVLPLLWQAIDRDKTRIITGLLEILETLGDRPEALALAHRLRDSGAVTTLAVLEEATGRWSDRLSPALFEALTQPDGGLACSLEMTFGSIAEELAILTQQPNPLLQALSLYELAQVSLETARSQARDLIQSPVPLVQATAARLLDPNLPAAPPLSAFAQLEPLVYLAESDFFAGLDSSTLMALGDRATIKSYQAQEWITEAGDTCRELLLLVAGSAQVERPTGAGGSRVEPLVPGQMLDELEVLTHSEQSGSIQACTDGTRVLAIPVDRFDDLLADDRELSRRILALESRRLQQVLSGAELSMA